MRSMRPNGERRLEHCTPFAAKRIAGTKGSLDSDLKTAEFARECGDVTRHGVEPVLLCRLIEGLDGVETAPEVSAARKLVLCLRKCADAFAFMAVVDQDFIVPDERPIKSLLSGPPAKGDVPAIVALRFK